MKAFIFPHKRQEEKKPTHLKILFIHDKNGHNSIKAETVVTFSMNSDQRILTIHTKEQRSV